MSGSYFDQFKIVVLFALTNSSMMMIITVAVGLLLFKGVKLVPNRWQSIIESIYDHLHGVVKDNLGPEGLKYFPFIISLFLFIVFLNVLGLFPYVFTPTVHIVVTLGLSFSIVIGVTLAGIWKFKGDFLSILMPDGAPLGLAPLLVLIETVSYISRAISLGVRLAANLSAGHLLFAILAGFSFSMLTAGGLISLFPLLIMVFITLLEMAVAVIQAYVFCLLTTIYLADTIVLH
uniref:ATP synthase subunit a n=4 Tax=Schizopathidae TaxID=223214 RepID=A0A6M4RG81_9CNID|nr:ATP synthase F0 subunit 6 [Bathypathes sp. n. 2 NB-2020]QJS34473.1 ATP synthase F0 subunit 6 [Bathypathes sp. n. 3 NB-2020]QJS34486.1 ATP synthase F0 subunit 6 [Bathypathes sp. 1 NB-2020]QJS34620.1 ATP synthase F0 subunit 6 [Stauropathes arctica]WHI93305.1 ATP synthase F0 subunit 6 [Bathypathes alaskensis]WHI93306.1 ATP synthase F0 subunit 6 [Stauropathes sp. CM-2023]WRM53906.1 ATP synthase F0 subunit 6 [Bathypathes sp. 1 YY-2024]